MMKKLFTSLILGLLLIPSFGRAVEFDDFPSSNTFVGVALNSTTAVAGNTGHVFANMNPRARVFESVYQSTNSTYAVYFSSSDDATWTKANGQCLGGASCPNMLSFPVNPLAVFTTFYFVLETGALGTSSLRSLFRSLQTR